MTFAEKLKNLRTDKKISQEKLGEIINIHAKHISKYEQAKVLPNAETLIKIAKYFNVSLDYLLFSQDEREKITDIDNVELSKKLEKVKQMPAEDKKVIISLLDAFINKNRQ